MNFRNGEIIREGQSGSEALPLEGKTVMVTRARSQSGEITSLLEELGARVIHCPAIEIVEPDDWAALDSAIARLSSYDWIVFTSANAVSFFFRRLAEPHSLQPAAIGHLKTCAIGPSTCDALKKAGTRVDLLAADSKSEGVLCALIQHAGGEDKLRGLRFLIPRARVAREILPFELSRLGAHVDAVEAYQTIKPDVDGESIVQLIKESPVDVITFTSSSTVSNFAALVGLKDLSGLLRNTLVACIGPVTAATAAEYGLTQIIQPDTYTATALACAIADSFSGERK